MGQFPFFDGFTALTMKFSDIITILKKKTSIPLLGNVLASRPRDLPLTRGLPYGLYALPF